MFLIQFGGLFIDRSLCMFILHKLITGAGHHVREKESFYELVKAETNNSVSCIRCLFLSWTISTQQCQDQVWTFIISGSLCSPFPVVRQPDGFEILADNAEFDLAFG